MHRGAAREDTRLNIFNFIFGIEISNLKFIVFKLQLLIAVIKCPMCRWTCHSGLDPESRDKNWIPAYPEASGRE